MPNQDAETYPFGKHLFDLVAEPASPAAGALEIYADQADNLMKQKSPAGTVTPFGGIVAAGSLLAVKSYRPATDVAVATTTSTTSADADATNLAVTFTAPASGKVLVRFTALERNVSSTTAIDYWQVREGTTVLADSWVNEGLIQARVRSVAFYLSGISAGSHTYKWGHRRAVAGTATMYGGPTFGELVMEVWAVP